MKRKDGALWRTCRWLGLWCACAMAALAHAAPAPFSQWVSQTPTLGEDVHEPSAYRLVDWNRDGTLDLVRIDTVGTASGLTEVQVYDGRSGYRAALLQAVTALHAIAGTGFHQFEFVDWNRDGALDLVLMLRGPTGTGTTEFHVLDGRTQFATWLLHTGSAIADDTGNFSYQFVDWNRDGVMDAVAIKRSATGTGSTEVHILDGGSGFQQFLLQTGTPLHETGSEFDFSLVDLTVTGATDGRPDLVAVKKRHTAGSVEVHVLSGRHAFQRWVIQTGSAIAALERDDGSYAMVDRGRIGGRPRLAVVRAGTHPDGRFQPGTVDVVSWPARGATRPVPSGTTFTVQNCNAFHARVEVRGAGGTQVWQLLPYDRIGESFTVAAGVTVELWAYLWYGTPPGWHGGFDRWLTGSSGAQTIALGYCP